MASSIRLGGTGLEGWTAGQPVVLAGEELSAANYYDTGVPIILQRIGAKAEEVGKKVWNKVTSVWATPAQDASAERQN